MARQTYDANRAGTRTYGGWEPRSCCVCGKKIRMGMGCYHYPNPKYGGSPYGHHHDCIEGLRYEPTRETAA